MQPSGFLIMGVSGSGKSTLGQALAFELGWDFFDADNFHTVENIAKMTAGIPLTDWEKIKGMSQDQAMQKYVDLVNQLKA